MYILLSAKKRAYFCKSIADRKSEPMSNKNCHTFQKYRGQGSICPLLEPGITGGVKTSFCLEWEFEHTFAKGDATIEMGRCIAIAFQ